MVAVKRALLVLGCVVAASIVVRAAALSAISDWPTYQHDAGRSGFDANQGAVTSISPAWTSALDGPVYAQPLVVGTTVTGVLALLLRARGQRAAPRGLERIAREPRP